MQSLVWRGSNFLMSSMLKITIPVPDALGDPMHVPPPVTELQPRFVRAATIQVRWGMPRKTFKTLLATGALKPRIQQGSLTLFAIEDVISLERNGWHGNDKLPPSENYPLKGDRAPETTTKK